MRQLEGLGEKSVTNLQEAIEKSKTQPLHRLITALGIRYVGETTAKALAQQTNQLMNLVDYSREELLQIEDVGIKVAESIYQFFHNHDNIRMLKELERLGLALEGRKEVVTGGNLKGKTFLFTGTLQKMKRSDAEEMVEKQGGKLLSGVSSKLNYLVVGEDAGSKLEKAKNIPQIQILDESAFIKITGYGEQ
jgi:DNA ligase (NAD+)